MEKGSDRRLSLKNDHSPAGEIRSRIVMLEFKPITAADGAWARPLLLKADCISCGYTFANLFVWSPVYHTDLARFQDFVIARCFDHPNTPDSPYLYLFPEGDGDKRAAIREIVQDAAVHGKMPRLYSLSQRHKAWLEEQFPGIFAFTSCRGTFDYIYSSEELQNLPGKKFQKKRNHVSRFLREHPDFVFEPTTPENLEEVRAFNNAWSQLYGNSQDTGIQTEHLAVEMGLKHFFELELSGGLIRADGKIIAFSYGSPVSGRVFDVHVEKALYDVNGAYNIINREFARRFCGDYQWINREDDVSEEGLRKAKLSYNPAFLQEKFCADLLGGETGCFG